MERLLKIQKSYSNFTIHIDFTNKNLFNILRIILNKIETGQKRIENSGFNETNFHLIINSIFLLVI